jgi:hypothetical protein
MHASTAIVMREVENLIPYARSSRAHDDPQVAQNRRVDLRDPCLVWGMSPV